MTALFLIFAFVFGTIIGSFFNVVLLRKNTGESLVFGGSRCFNCGRRLLWYENIPLVSFAFQRGKCRGCYSAISWQYPAVELLAGIISFLIFYKLTYAAVILNSALLLYPAALLSLFVLAAYDVRTKIIDRHLMRIFLAFALAVFLFRWAGYFEPATEPLFDIISSLAIFIFFYALWFVSRGTWMGRGDSDVALAVAIFGGFPLNIVILLLSFWSGTIIGMVLLVFEAVRRRITGRTLGLSLRTEIPFAPFLALGALAAWYFQEFFLSIISTLF